MSTIQKAAAAYAARVDSVVEQATTSPMFQARVTRELVRKTAATSDVHNILSAIYRGLMDGTENPALRPFCEIAMEEISLTMKRISERHPNRMKQEA